MSDFQRPLSRRSLFKAAAVAVAAGTVAGAAVPRAAAQGRILGTVIDYAAGVPSAASVKAAGHLGAVRYVSQRRPGAEWMLGKPVTLRETTDFAKNGLSTASVYQFGKADTADWKRGAAGVAEHAPQAIALHKAAGGPTGVPIYVAIDDNPTRDQYTNLIRPYLRGFDTALRAAGYTLGIYGNYSTIEWAIADGLGTHFWQHNWGSQGRIHPSIHLHQVRIDKDTVGGVGVDVNNVYRADWGQWTPGAAPVTPPTAPSNPGTPATPPAPGVTIPANSSLSDIPDINVNGSSVSGEQIQQGLQLAQQIATALK